MTPIHLIGITYALPIPEDASAIVSHVAGGTQKIMFSSKIQDPAQCGGDMITLPQGNWQIICTTKECTEEQAKGIVQIISNGKITGQPQYRRYDRDMVKDTPARCWTRDPRHALETLVASKGLDPNKNYLIIKKVS